MLKVNKPSRKNTKIIFAVVAIAILSFSLGAAIVKATGSAPNFTISSGVYPGAPTYTVFPDGLGNYYAKDAYGMIDYSGTNAATIIQDALNGLTVGRTYIQTVECTGYFPISTILNIPSYAQLLLNGEIQWAGSSGTSGYMMQNSGNNQILITGGIYDGGNAVGQIMNMEGISNFQVQGTYQTNILQMGAFMVFFGSDNGVISNNNVYGGNKGLGIDLYDGCHNIVVSQNTFNLTYDSAISVGSTGGGVLCYDITITGNAAYGYSSGNANGGISVFGLAQDITITGNVCDNFYGDGVVIQVEGGFTPNSITVTSNILRGNLLYGIGLSGQNCTASSNIINNSGYGIYINNFFNTASSNTINNCGTSGIYIYASQQNEVLLGNQCHNSPYGVIISSGCTHIQSVGNNYLDNSVSNYTNNAGAGTTSIGDLY
jgi:hypothetical protein